MASIYIHIPFCKQACHYCDFHFSTSLKLKDSFLNALKKEIELRKDYLERENISTVYFGGGTPSLLSSEEITEIVDELKKYHKISSGAEITLEANPDDLTSEKINELGRTPVNRLSIGIQSFFDEDLKFMNRAHNAKEALQSVTNAQSAGFNNISIDLIYGTPGLSNERWKQNLKTAFELGVKHISAYNLTVEPKTPLAHFVKTGKAKNVDEKQSEDQFNILMDEMKKNNFIQYEISNFCKDGWYSKHNSSYWKKEKYLGLGPSAHSFNGNTRQWNIANTPLYIKSLEENNLNFEEEILTPEQKYNDYILTTLRTMWGTDLWEVKKSFGSKMKEYCLNEAQEYLKSESLKLEGNKLILTDKGKLLADRIASDLFWV